ncbi:MAG: hypothetical protein ACJAVV_003157 [Alphaproteobacteria bacterium]|jgi:hypothetical protein
MKHIAIVMLSASLVCFSNSSFAQAELEMTWQNPEKFSDVRPTSESRSKFRERTFKQLNEHINELAQDLPEGQKLVMNVTNLDLAGEVLPASFAGLGHSTSDVRVVKRIHIPRMNFSYQLLASDGAVLQENEVKLKDMSFLDGHNHFFSSETLRYEKSMLAEWFDDEFPK